MSINNLEKTFENNLLIYCNLNDKIIIECIYLSELYLINKYNDKSFLCDEVKIITIYDIYKNIISEPIRTDLFKDPIKICDILKNLKEKCIYFFKTFIEAFLINNKLNNIKYNINYSISNFSYNFLYDNVHIKLYNFYNNFIIYNDKRNIIYMFYIYDDIIYIYCYENENCIIYTINNHCIEIDITKKLYNKSISFHKENLKIFEIKKYYNFTIIYNEKRNYNNEITSWKKRNNEEIKKEFISNNINPPFSKPLKRYYIELINHYNKNINIFIKIIKPIFKKINEAHYNLLLNYNLEMIYFK